MESMFSYHIAAVMLVPLGLQVSAMRRAHDVALVKILRLLIYAKYNCCWSSCSTIDSDIWLLHVVYCLKTKNITKQSVFSLTHELDENLGFWPAFDQLD